MRTLSYHVASTLDGYISEPGDNFERFVTEGEHVDEFLASLRNFDAVLMGTATYGVSYRAGMINPCPGQGDLAMRRREAGQIASGRTPHRRNYPEAAPAVIRPRHSAVC